MVLDNMKTSYLRVVDTLCKKLSMRNGSWVMSCQGFWIKL